MTFAFDEFAASVKAGTPITARDTLALRQWSWADGEISEADANAVFEINNLGRSNAPEWVDFFVETLCDYVVNSKAPKGYIDDSNAAWLMQRIDRDGLVESLGELELLVKVLEKATNAPESLKAYALTQMEQVVVTGVGPTRDGGQLCTGTIDAAEVKLLRRMLFAQASDGPASISKSEAEMLFRIKDTTLGANNAPEWQTLFVQAVGQHLMAHNSYQPLVREDAARLETFMDNNKSSIGGFFGRMVKSDFSDVFGSLFGSKATITSHDAAVAADRAITGEEKVWLRNKIDADATLDPLEKALLAFIAEESGEQLS